MDVTLTLKCNNDCIFCPRHDYLKIIASVSQSSARRDIQLTRRSSSKIALSGGEVTCLKYLIPLLNFCKKEGFRHIDIITNGRKFKDQKFLKEVLGAGVTDVAVSVYSTKPEIHDKITRRPGSCQETQAGLSNLLKASKEYALAIRVNVVLNYWNKDDIYATLDKLLARGVRSFIVSEQIIVNSKDRFLDLDGIKRFLKKVMTVRLEEAYLCLRGFAPCLFPRELVKTKYGDGVIKKRDPVLSFETHGVDTLVKEKEKKTDYLNRFAASFVRLEVCPRCIFRSRCPGLQKVYAL